MEKIKISLKFNKHNGYFMRTSMYVYDNDSLNSYKNDKSFGQKLYRKSKRILHSTFFSKNRAVYELMCKNMVQTD